MEQGFFPDRIARYRIQIIQTDQLALLQIIQKRGAVFRHLRQWQIHRQLTALFNAQAGGLKQMTAPHSGTAPQIDQLIGPASCG